MKSTDLIDRIASATGGTKADAKKAFDTVWFSIIEAAQKGEEVSIPGFGKFQVRTTAKRQGRNPKTGEVITIPESKKLSYSSAKQVKVAMSSKHK